MSSNLYAAIYGVDIGNAIRQLATKTGATSKGREEVWAAQRKLEQKRAEREAKREADHRKRIATRDLLHALEHHAKLASVRLWNRQVGPKGADVESEWELLQLLADAISETEAEYLELSDWSFRNEHAPRFQFSNRQSRDDSPL